MLVPTYVGCLFFHLKGLKHDRGNHNFYFKENPDSLYRDNLKQHWKRRDLMTFEELVAAVPEVRNLPHPIGSAFACLRGCRPEAEPAYAAELIAVVLALAGQCSAPSLPRRSGSARL